MATTPPPAPNTGAIEKELRLAAADSVFTSVELDSLIKLLNSHQDALDAQREYYEDRLAKLQRASALMVIGIFGVAIGGVSFGLFAAGITPTLIWGSVGSMVFGFVQCIIVLVNKGWLGGTWIHVANILNAFKTQLKAVAPPDVSKQAETIEKHVDEAIPPNPAAVAPVPSATTTAAVSTVVDPHTTGTDPANPAPV